MSWQARLAGAIARRFLRPSLARQTDPVRVRRGFERLALLCFRDPPFALHMTDSLSLPDREIPTLLERGARCGDGVLLWCHGGAYIAGSPRTHRAMVARLAQMAEVEAVLPDYRLAPEYPFPAAFDDCMGAYLALLRRGVPPSRIVLGGDSAGGGLALAVLGDLQRRDLPAPAGLLAFSPLTDMTFSGASFRTNAARDVLLPAERAPDVRGFYLQGGDARDPRASPLFADWVRPPPALLFASSSELLLDDSLRMASRLRASGGEAECSIWSDLPHVWPILQGWLPEGDAALEHAAEFLRRRLGAAPWRRSRAGGGAQEVGV